MNRYAARIGSAFSLALTLFALGHAGALAADRAAYFFDGKPIVFTRLIAQQGGRAVAIDDPGLVALFRTLGATATWQSGERYVLVTTAEPVVVSFAIGDRRYDVGPVTQTASFAPFLLDGDAYVPFNELLRALDLSAKPDGARMVLQPQLVSLDMQSSGSATTLIARGGVPLDARIVSDADGKMVVGFDGVGSTLQSTRALSGGAVRRIDVRTDGTVTHPRTLVTLVLAPGTTHTGIGTDDQRDFTIGFDGASIAQSAIAQSAVAQVTALPSPVASAMAQVTGVQSQAVDGGLHVRVALSGDASYDWRRLRPPDNRFWLDIHGVRLAQAPSDRPGNGVVAGIRVHQENADTVRIALSLSGFQSINVVPDAQGVTITVGDALVGLDAPRSGSGTIGQDAGAVAVVPKVTAPASPQSTYVAANPRLIVIDPGHGGTDPGSFRGDAVEKSFNLDISLRLRDILVTRGWQVMMTRSTDRDVYAPNDSADDELQARDDVANGNGARVFVSVHTNAFMNSGPHGATVYYYKPADVALAQAIDRRLSSELSIKNDGIVKDKLYVVHHADMPAALVETAFVSNPDDRALLQSPQWRQKMALALADGIGDFTGPPPARAQSGQQ